jgi:hydrogenase maturation protease
MIHVNNKRMDDGHSRQILILGIGCILFRDEGFGVRVIEKLQERYEFPENVSLVDGGVLGLNLLSVLSEADYLIVVDAVRNRGNPGDLYRLEGDAIPDRIREKNSLHQVDFLETLTVCQALDKVPETVIFGVEPEDIESLSLDLTPATRARVDQVIDLVLDEIRQLGVTYRRRSK